MEPAYLPQLIELMRANNFAEADIVDVTSRLIGPHPADLVVQREVIATAVLTGLFANMGTRAEHCITDAVEAADALIAELAK